MDFIIKAEQIQNYLFHCKDNLGFGGWIYLGLDEYTYFWKKENPAK